MSDGGGRGRDATRNAGDALRLFHQCVAEFTQDADGNVGRLMRAAATALGASWTQYSRLVEDELRVVCAWNAPAELAPASVIRGRVFRDVIDRNLPAPVTIRRLPETPYRTTDPLLVHHGIHTCVGMVVRWRAQPVGVVSALHDRDFEPEPQDLDFLALLAAMAGAEEQRRRAVAELEERERFLASVFAGIQDGISILDRDMRVVRVNASMERWFAHAAPLVGRKCYEVYHNRREPCEVCPSRRALETGLAGSEIVARHGSDGRPVGWIDLHAFPLFDRAGGEITGVIEHARDMSERRRMEDRLRQTKGVPEAQLAQARRLETVGRLAGGVAHEFNNMLTVINGFSELLQEQLEEGDARRRNVEEILRAGRRAAAVTRQLMEFGRRHELQPAAVDLNRIVTDSVCLLQRILKGKIRIETGLTPGIGLTMVDAHHLDQAILNLAMNARDAMPEGGCITIATDPVDVGLDDSQRPPDVPPGSYLRLTVADTGVGMNEETRAHLFEPFYTTKPQGEGTGLGLASVYGFVAQSGGHIAVDTAPGKGCRFRIYLPRADSPAANAAAYPL